jgi:signal transduction histidine kinase/CheY-like chemotaxis protein
MKKSFERWIRNLRTPRSRPEDRSDLRDELVALASDLAVETDFEPLMTRMCGRMRRLVGCDRCSIFILEDGAYRARFNVGNSPEVARFFADLRLPLDHPLISRAVETRKQVTVNDAQNDPLMDPERTKQARIHSIVVAPLLNDKEGALGFISAEFNEAGREFRPEQSELFDGIASIVALAIERHESRRERDLIRSQMEATSHLAALGRFAGSIAHDFNNRLTVIVGTAELIAEEVRGTQIEPDLEELLRSAEASADLTQKLFDLSTGRLDRDAACSVSVVLTSAHGLLRRLVPEDIDFSVGVHGVELNVGLDHHDLERVITNLVVNLVEACAPGIGIHVDTRPVELGSAGQRNWTTLDAGSYVEISVGYSGCGADSNVLARVLEPFETTHDGNSGVGLAIVSSLVQDAGGALRIDSDSGNGSRFVILLPRLEGSLQEDFDRRQEPSLTGNTATILLVDDDEPIRRLVRRSLSARGHEIIEAGSATDALDIAKAFEGEIDILLTDVVMPGMSGIELAKSLVRVRPELQVLFMSGYAPGIRGEADFEPANSRFIPKPFSTARIAEAVDSCFTRISRLH